ncbi:unnamed protein product [Sphenostylis stenocarpa]|uniref:Homeobox domain-containing protein n=1 Tax=Sphenostylis stenocarpa TaxID=92480 RepID=A0AA87B8J0_9FABA|nr:unnamed protein product [Sphenostylis stenocarpa]
MNNINNGAAGRSLRGIDVNTVPAEVAVTVAMTTDLEEAAAVSPSSNSAAAWFQLDLCIFNRGRSVSGEDGDERQMAYSKGSDEDNNGDGGGDCDDGSARKKLRLSKEQSGFLEESFKEHNTLNPKQKLALAKQLDLRPRQVEVWFQNRRASDGLDGWMHACRSKLKQTEVECEYMKRCCETLREENRRLEKELQELRVLKTLNPFCMHSPPTTLTMCPSCELVATNSTTTTSNASSNTVTVKTIHQPTTPQNLKGFV